MSDVLAGPLTSPVPAGDRRLVALHSQTGAALIAATVFASMVGFVDASVVNVAIPSIGRDLHAGVAALQWSLTGYLLTAAALLLVAGALADRFGRRRILTIGLSLMLVTSLLCAVAPSIGALIAARVVQGAGAAMVVPSSLSLLNGTLRVGDRARGIGTWAGLATIGSTVGPYAGGWLVGHASWRWVFLLNLPLIVAALLVLRVVPESERDRTVTRTDVVGGVLAVVGLGGVIYALTDGPSHGWLSARVIVAAVVGAAALAVLVPFERRSASPMVRLSLFGSRQFDAINVTTVLFYGALGAAPYLLILQCQLRLGYSPAQSGAVLIPQSAVFLAVSPIAGALVGRFGPRRLMVAGILIVAAAFLWLSQVEPGDSYATAILPGALLNGLGLGLAVTPLTAAVLAAVSDHDLGEASAVNDASARVGALVAVALVPALIGASGGLGFAAALADGYQPAMIVLAGVCAGGALVTALFVSDARAATAAPRFAPPVPQHGCVPPVSGAAP
jgi:EmrB/QacA subfamily drug resistance transporter